MDQHDDPFDFINKLSHISSSQEELLRRCAFVGEESVSSDDKPPPASAGFPVASAGILMVSLSETQDAGKDATVPHDVFHAPPENSSIPTRTVNQGLHVDDEALQFVDLRGYPEGTGCVDLGRDSDLGFSEVQLAQGIDGELVAESSRGIKRDAVGDKFGCLEKELSSEDGIGELPIKRLKLSEPKSGFDSSRACLGIESQKVEEGMGNCNGKRGSGAESPCNSGADLRPQKIVLVGEQEQVFGDNACGEIPVDKKNLGSLLENAQNELESGEEGTRKDKSSIFDVLKVLKENSDDDEDGLEDVSLLEAVKIRGITFPRPRWWPDNDNDWKQRIA